MNERYITANDFFYIVPVSLILGAGFSFIQQGNGLIGVLAFSFVFFIALVFLQIAQRWSNGGRTLGYILALAFVVRLAVGVTLHLALPIYGHEDEDDRAGYVYTDAHKRDNQAWALATSEHSLFNAFSSKYASDQYGGLLAFNAFLYRYLSPDAQRPLLLIVFSAFFAALGVSFLWKSARQIFGEPAAWASAWIFSLYPESILLGASAMREPYLLTFSAFTLWGFVEWQYRAVAPETLGKRVWNGWIWFGLGLSGMLLVSPVVALMTIVIFGGWVFFTDEGRELSWKGILAVAIVFMAGLFFLSSSLNRSSQFDATSPLHVINDWLRLAVKWDAYQLERDSGWVQKIFDEGPRWIRLPFIALYGIAQPVLPASFIHPTKFIWATISLLRGLGWYLTLPLLILCVVAAAGAESRKRRSVILWLSLMVWIWILLAAIRGGADLYDNPRYRTILFVWQAVLAGMVWVWWRETRNPWFLRVILMEGLFLLVFTQWYASRYLHWGGQLPFPIMIAVILALWGLVLVFGWWRDQKSSGKRA